MKKFLSIIIIYSVLFSCKHDLENPSWDVDMIVPIANAEININDIVEECNNQVNTNYNDDNLVSLVYTNNILTSEYDSLFVVIKDIDITSAKPNLKKYNESLEYSKTQLSSDKKPSLKTMKFMNDMKLMKRQFKNAATTKNNLLSNTARNQEQLNNLLNDIDNGIFDNEELNLILTREQQAVKEVSNSLIQFEESFTNAENGFDSLYQLSQTFQYD